MLPYYSIHVDEMTKKSSGVIHFFYGTLYQLHIILSHLILYYLLAFISNFQLSFNCPLITLSCTDFHAQILAVLNLCYLFQPYCSNEQLYNFPKGRVN